jgi:hypothetical protein
MYKDHLIAARYRRDGLVREYSGAPVPAHLLTLYAVRQARRWAGVAGIAGFLALVLELFLGARHSSTILMLSWGLVLAVFVAVRVLARWRMGRLLAGELTPSADVFADLTRLDRGTPQDALRQRVSRLEISSLVLPVAAATLLLPLTLHLLVGSSLLNVYLSDFNAWILLSLVLVGHAHLTLLVFSVLHVSRVCRELDLGDQVGGAGRGLWALLWTITASAIPGAIFLFIPPLLVALTGLTFVPWMFFWVARRARSERLLLQVAATSASDS